MVWVECVKALLVNVCNDTAKPAEIDQGTCEFPLDNTLIVLGGGPLYIPFCMRGRSFSGGLFSTQPSRRRLDQVTMWESTGQQR